MVVIFVQDEVTRENS